MEGFRRRSVRLKGYDYSRAGYYFVTINSRESECTFGKVVAGRVELSDIGKMVAQEWSRTGEIRKEIRLDEWILMPNHVHAVVVILNTESGSPIGPYVSRSASSRKARSLSSLIGGFKSKTSSRAKTPSERAITSIWQRNYYEHVIRNERSLNLIRLYIQLNPRMWEENIDFDLSNMSLEEIDARLARFRNEM